MSDSEKNKRGTQSAVEETNKVETSVEPDRSDQALNDSDKNHISNKMSLCYHQFFSYYTFEKNEEDIGNNDIETTVKYKAVESSLLENNKRTLTPSNETNITVYNSSDKTAAVKNSKVDCITIENSQEPEATSEIPSSISNMLSEEYLEESPSKTTRLFTKDKKTFIDSLTPEKSENLLKNSNIIMQVNDSKVRDSKTRKNINNKKLKSNALSKVNVKCKNKSKRLLKKRSTATKKDLKTLRKNDNNKKNNNSDSEDDPDKLWCICRKPYNNRFMIQCDSCEEWYHGSCVGINRNLGLRLEKEEKEWRCPICSQKIAALEDMSCSESEPGTSKNTNEVIELSSDDSIDDPVLLSTPPWELQSVSRMCDSVYQYVPAKDTESAKEEESQAVSHSWEEVNEVIELSSDDSIDDPVLLSTPPWELQSVSRMCDSVYQYVPAKDTESAKEEESQAVSHSWEEVEFPRMEDPQWEDATRMHRNHLFSQNCRICLSVQPEQITTVENGTPEKTYVANIITIGLSSPPIIDLTSDSPEKISSKRVGDESTMEKDQEPTATVSIKTKSDFKRQVECYSPPPVNTSYTPPLPSSNQGITIEDQADECIFDSDEINVVNFQVL